MLIAPDIDPVAISLGPIKVHWYGLMYVAGFLGGWWLGRYRAMKPDSGWRRHEVLDLVFYLAIGVIAGGRLGYVLFYNFGYYLRHPLEIFFIWTGGMSFHGGLLGVLVALWLFNRKYQKGYWNIVDFAAPMIPLGLGAGRIGNFINAELWGKPTDLPWGMIFPAAGPVPRHPTPLYEALLEGLMRLQDKIRGQKIAKRPSQRETGWLSWLANFARAGAKVDDELPLPHHAGYVDVADAKQSILFVAIATAVSIICILFYLPPALADLKLIKVRLSRKQELEKRFALKTTRLPDAK